tara:strand:- start:1410 stop:1559 length:150 start_codon:yes stop_codon:yes gene_type:complete
MRAKTDVLGVQNMRIIFYPRENASEERKKERKKERKGFGAEEASPYLHF